VTSHVQAIKANQQSTLQVLCFNYESN